MFYRRAQDVTLVVSGNIVQCVGTDAVDFSGIGKAQRITLKDRVSHGYAAVVHMRTASHNVPFVGMIAQTATLIVGVIEVGQPQHMAELMANGADAGGHGEAIGFPAINFS